MAMPRSSTRSSVRTTVRNYLWTEESVWRLPSRLHVELVSARTALSALANSRQRVVEAYVSRVGKRPLLVKAREVYYSFDAQGYLDVASAAEAMAIAVDSHEGQTGHNVVSLGPRLRDRQWRREHTWKPSREALRQITGDVAGVKRVRSLKA